MPEYTIEPINKEPSYTIEPDTSGVLSLRQGKPSSAWDNFMSYFGADAEKEKAKAANSLTYASLFNIAPSTAYEFHDEISQQVQDKLSTEKIITEKKGLGTAYETGRDTSIYGLMKNQKVPAPFESVSQLERWIHGGTAMAFDLPVFLTGMALGGGLTTVSGWGGAFALPQGLRQVLIDKYSKGDVRDFRDFMDRTGNAVRETIKGEIVGGLTGMSGMALPTSAIGYKAMVELATMTAASKLIEGQIPTARDFVDNAALLLMMHAGIKGYEAGKGGIYEIKTKLQNKFSEVGSHPKAVTENIISKTATEVQDDLSAVIDNAVNETIPAGAKLEGKGKPTEEGQKTPETQPTGETGIANKEVGAERIARGEEPLQSTKGMSAEQIYNLAKEKVDRGDIKPEELTKQINNAVEIGEQPIALTGVENIAMEYQIQKYKNEHYALEQEITKLETEGKDTTALKDRRNDIEVLRNETEKALRETGSAQSEALWSRKILGAEDYSYSGMIQRAKEQGIPLTDEARDFYKKQSSKIEKIQAEINKEGEAKSTESLDKTIKIIKNEEGLIQRKEKRTYKKEELDAEFDSLINEFAKSSGSQFGSILGGIELENTKIFVSLARNRIQKGIVTAEGIVDEIYTALKNAGIEYSKRDIRDAISQYGVTKEMSKEAIDVALREAKTQMRLISAFEDATKGEVPLRTGLQRDKASDRVRELQREVRQAMRESGIDSRTAKSPEEQWKTSLDAVKTRLKNSIADLVKQFETGEKTPKKIGIKYDEQAESLKALRDKIKDVLEFVEETKGKTNISPEQRIKTATAAVEKSIAEYERRITEEDLTPKKKTSQTPVTPELEALRKERDLLKDIYKMMQEEAKPKLTPEQIALKAFKTRTENQIKEYERRLAEGDFTPKPKKEPLALGESELKLKFELDQLKKEYVKRDLEYQLSQRGTFKKITDAVAESMNLIKAIKSSFDISAVGRQGFFAFISHPITGFKNIPEMFRALGSEEASFRIESEIQKRSNYPLYDKAGLSLTETSGKGFKVEEIYNSRWAEMVPGIPASERAFVSFLNLTRADLFDFLHDNNFSKVGKVASEKELKALGNYVNEATGRGTIKGYEGALQGLGTFLWAPKLVLSRFQMLMGHGMWEGTSTTRTAIAKEYARILTGLGVIYAVSSILGGRLEDDPRSSDFGKIIVGNTRIDPLAGVSQATVFISRIYTGETKNLRTGKITPLTGDYVPYGGTTVAGVIGNFLRSKLTPVLGEVITFRQGKDLAGKKVTLYDIPEHLLLPLAVSDIYQAMSEEGVPIGAALGTLGMFGVGIQTHEQKGARP